MPPRQGTQETAPTARPIWQRVTDQKGFDVAEPNGRAYVRRRKRELGIGVEVFAPQHHPCGAQAEADFYASPPRRCTPPGFRRA
jgi:hypothetical protein